MRKLIIPFVLCILLCLSACSNVSQEEYTALLQECEELKAQVTQLEENVDSLTESYNTSQANNVVLKQHLSDTYNGYRYILIDVTNVLLDGPMSMDDWEEIISTRTSTIPTFEEVDAAVSAP